MRYHFRHGSNKTLVSVDIFETPYPESDDQYDLAVCHYTGALIQRNEGIVLGAVVPQVNVSYLCHPLAVDARKREVLLFQVSEQNCNTCRYLKRVKFERSYWKQSGLMPGECLNEARQPLYPREGNSILFAPDDCMLQPCHEQRSV